MPDRRTAGSGPGRAPGYLAPDDRDTLISVRVIPRAGRTELAGERAGALLVRLAAPPVDNAANETLLRFLSEVLDVPRSSVALVRGERSRSKRVRVRQMETGLVAARLAGFQGITLL